MQCGGNNRLPKIFEIFLLFFITVCSGNLAACQSKLVDAVSILLPCQELIDKNDLIAAGKCYEGKLAANSEQSDQIEEIFSQSFFKKCVEFKEKENFGQAIVCFEGVSVIKPDSANTWFLLARSYYEYNKTKRADDLELLGRAEEAIKICLKINPTDADAHYTYGRILQQKSNWREAIAKYRQAIELQPKTFFYWIELAFAQEYLGETSSALISYYQALQLNPENESALYNSAKLYEKTGNKDQAIENYEKLLKIRAEYDDARERLEKLKEKKAEPKQKTKIQGRANDGTSRLSN